jgi:molecular chaperone GrpE
MRIQVVGRVAGGWFPLLDDLLRALKERPTAENFATWADGMDLIYRKGMGTLEMEGIAPIRPEPGEAFDPNRHEAVTMEPCAERKDGEIIETLRCGYVMGERVLRPAQVRVACER